MSRIPSKSEIAAWVSENPTQASKRDIARAFGVKGADRVELKRLLRELEDEGHLERRRKSYRDPERLPPVAVMEITEPDEEGNLYARPVEWDGAGAAPLALYMPRRSDPALAPGQRILARLRETGELEPPYEARLLKRLASAPRRMLGIFRRGSDGGRLLPLEKGDTREWIVPAGAQGGAEDGELVEAERTGPRAAMGVAKARVISRLGNPMAPRSFSLIAIHRHGIPDIFPDAVLDEAEALDPPAPEAREDLTDLPFITIDPEDARDHDDAVVACPDPDPRNAGGHVLWVAIADVAHFVRPGTALDAEARRRGNSTYFPDRVVPMLPERLSADLCSLIAGADRSVIAVRLKVGPEGAVHGHRFARALIRVRANLAYEAVQAVQDGQAAPEAAEALAEGAIAPLFAAYEALASARSRRGPLDLDLPEREIELSEDGRVRAVRLKERLTAHRLVEEAMIQANVAAAEAVTRLSQPLLFRVHEEPAAEKLEALRDVAAASGFSLAKGQVLQPRHLNTLLDAALETDFSELIHYATLRAMTQAYYAPENLGHFGLALRAYAHFTSPIRRYADLVVHRALITAHGWGADGLSADEIERLPGTAEHISETERRSMLAERETADRYLAAYLADRVGAEFSGRVAGVSRAGLFVRLDETGADGLVPISRIGREYFHHDREGQTLMGAESGQVIGLGQRVRVRLQEAAPVTGGLRLELLEVEGEGVSPTPRPKTQSRGRPARAKTGSGARRRRAARR